MRRNEWSRSPECATGRTNPPSVLSSSGLSRPPRHSCACSDERPLLNVRHDERTDRAVIAAVSDTHMAMMILTGSDLLTREQVACWNVKPAGNRLHQLIAGDRETIHIAAAV